MTDANGRQAAAIKVSISNYVGTATLALIAGGVALYTYVQQHLSPSWVFYVLMLAAILVLVLSFIFGGKGANTTAEQVAAGTWSKDTKTTFDLQAVLTLAGLTLLLAAAVLSTAEPRVTVRDPCVQLMTTQLAQRHAKPPQILEELRLCEAARS